MLTKVTGTFSNASEDLLIGGGGTSGFDDDAFDSGGFDSDAFDMYTGTAEANTDAAGYADSAPTSKLTAQYNNLAADAYRADIAVVP